MSTIVGFACSVGLKMTFNADHHKGAAGAQQKGHEHGKSHEHNVSEDHQNPASHHEDPTDLHPEQSGDHKQVTKAQENTAGDCCKDEAAKFERSDKRAPQSFNYNIRPLFVALTFNTPFNTDVIASYLRLPGNKYFVRNHHPPIADTRIAIQSFLI